MTGRRVHGGCIERSATEGRGRRGGGGVGGGSLWKEEKRKKV
jgi:hypothetical protein